MSGLPRPIRAVLPAGTIHSPRAVYIAHARDAMARGWGGGRDIWSAIQFRQGCELVDEDTIVTVLDLDSGTRCAAVEMPDGMVRWVDADALRR